MRDSWRSSNLFPVEGRIGDLRLGLRVIPGVKLCTMVLVRLDKKCREGKADCQGVVCRRVCFDFIRRTMQINYHRTIQNALCENNPSYLELTVGNSTRGHGCSLVQLYCPLRRQHVFVEFREEYFQLLHCGSVYSEFGMSESVSKNERRRKLETLQSTWRSTSSTSAVNSLLQPRWRTW